MKFDKVGVGIVGCGNISGIYLENLSRRFPCVELRACADLEHSRAAAVAAKYPGVRACSVDELLASDDIAIILNLTIPVAHAEIALRAVRAGKHVYNEKPLTLEKAQARELLDEAAARGVLTGCAPDTVLGAGIQTCRKLIDEGAIGRPVAATAFMMCHGHEGWHPNPFFYYEPGGGPMFDMGPYYLSALITLLGPVQRVSGAARQSFDQRTITADPNKGRIIDVKVPTHVAGVLEFGAGAVATVITSFDVWSHNCPRIEIYGSEGTLAVPDPNTFGGPVRLRCCDSKEWQEIGLAHQYAENSRGLGVADLAMAIQQQRRPRASGELAAHVLDVMHGVHEACAAGRYVELGAPDVQPAAATPKAVEEWDV